MEKKNKIAAGAQNDTVEYGLIGHTINSRTTPSKSLEFEKCWSEKLKPATRSEVEAEAEANLASLWSLSSRLN